MAILDWFGPSKKEIELENHISKLTLTIEEFRNQYLELNRHAVNYAEAYLVLKEFISTLKGKKAQQALKEAQNSFLGIKDPFRFVNKIEGIDTKASCMFGNDNDPWCYFHNDYCEKE